MNRRAITNWISLVVMLLSAPAPASTQQSKNMSEISYERARRVLDAGVIALGGLPNIRRVEDISFKVSGSAYEQGQSANPAKPYYVRHVEGMRTIDVRRRRSYFESKTNFRGGDLYQGRKVLKEGAGFCLDLTSHVAYPIAPLSVASSARAVQRLLPNLLLQAVLSRAGTLRWLGKSVGGHHHKDEIVSFADAAGNQITLYFDSQTSLLTKYETLGDDPVFGDTLRETAFSDYRDIEGLKIPARVITKYSGETVSNVTYSDIKLNTHPSDELFEVPAGFDTGPEIEGTPSPIVTKLADGIYFVNGVSGGDIWFYSQLVVAFKEHLLVLEAPLDDGVSQAVMTKIKDMAPEKPIKYLVPTHYHFDHLGGIRGYIAAGATVITTPGNREFIENLATARHTIRPDSLSLNWRKPLIETFSRKKVISDGHLTVELYDLGIGPHSDEMVIAYIPQEKILFVSDLCMTRLKGTIPPASRTNIDFARKIRALNLQVETIANGHGWLGTMKAFEDALERGQH